MRSRRVVAIVVNRNHRDHLTRCLRHLDGLAEACSEVIVADDASTDGSVDTVRREFPKTHVVEASEHVGAAATRNLGIRFAMERLEFDYLLFLDNDAFVEPDTLMRLLDAIERDEATGIVTPKAYQDMAARRLHLAGELAVNLYTGRVRDVGAGEVDVGQHDTPRRIAVCSGFTMLVRREVVERLGGFDEEFALAAWEDVDFCLRAGKSGFEIAYAPAAIVEHVGGVRGRGRMAEREKAKAKNWFVLMRRHATPLQWISFLAFLPVRSAGLAFRRLVEGDAWAVLAQVAGVREAIQRVTQRRQSG
ncbi:MAG: glycosyltransferase family 2 protein [Gemmatimonadales bacterium]|jgi:GT2 family glycosyltransferase